MMDGGRGPFSSPTPDAKASANQATTPFQFTGVSLGRSAHATMKTDSDEEESPLVSGSPFAATSLDPRMRGRRPKPKAPLQVVNPGATTAPPISDPIPQQTSMLERLSPVDVNGARQTIDPGLLDAQKLSHLSSLRNHGLSMTRLLYGSDRNRFYDLLTYPHIQAPGSSPTGSGDMPRYAAALTCQIEGSTRILRTTAADDEVDALGLLTSGLARDAGVLMSQRPIGSILHSQQGATDPATGTFQLFTPENKAWLQHEARDSLRSMQGVRGALRGPTAYYGGGGGRDSYRPPKRRIVEDGEADGKEEGGKADVEMQ